MSPPPGTVAIRCEYTLLRREEPHSESAEAHTFRQTHASGRSVEMELSYLNGNILASMIDVDLGDAVLAELRPLHKFDGSDLSVESQAAIEAPLTEIRSSVRDLLALLKYHLRHFDLREGSFSVLSERWETSLGEQRDFPTTFSISHENFSNQPLNEVTHDAVQVALQNGVHPLIAMRHLHRAKQESQPHHKWIDATIAAELAVKEVLCRAHPGMELMLVEMPSPPFSKMYGSLLKHYLGEESPFRKKLISGQEKRNSLVHRPGSLEVDRQEANDYVDVVEGAIFHLLSLLYPNDALIKYALQNWGNWGQTPI